MLLRCLILFFLCLQSAYAYEQDKDKHFCDMPSKDCLIWVEQALQSAQPQTMEWYNFKLWQLDSLSTVKEHKRLQKELDTLKDIPNLPPTFSLSLKIYQAKLFLINGGKQQAMSLLTTSLMQLKQLNQVFYSPIRMVMIANLMLDLEQYEQARDWLEQLKSEYATSKDIFLKLELYGNLGHAYRFLKRYEDALSNYLESLQFAIELGNEQQISILYTHVAHMYQQTSRLELAEQNFKQALIHALKDTHDVTVIGAKINLAYFYIQQEQLEKARVLIKDIDGAKVEPYQRSIWLAINQTLQTSS